MAGLSAAVKLVEAGISVEIVEARDRIGGRVYTQPDPALVAPIELGAEFIHGCPPEIWERVNDAGLKTVEVDGGNWCVRAGMLERCSFFPQVEAIMNKMDSSGPDESFLDFLERCHPEAELAEAKQKALRYITGFHAADPNLVGVHWLVKDRDAEAQIEGDRAFRLGNGYVEFVDLFRARLEKAGVQIRTETTVEHLQWTPNHVELGIRSGGGSSTMTASKVLVTVPVGVLKTANGELGAIEFSPMLPRKKLDAIAKLEMGKVLRLVLRFRERFWTEISNDSGENLKNLSFLFSEDDLFPTWWTTSPVESPILTAWAPFRSAERLRGQSKDAVTRQALAGLGQALSVSEAALNDQFEELYMHDWQADPFSRGAYSYGKVGADGAHAALASPVGNTLFFAGEATDTGGHNGTVHGAIASGERAAAEIRTSISV